MAGCVQKKISTGVRRALGIMRLSDSSSRIEKARAAFDEAFYLDKYPDVRNANVDAFSHYLRYGWKEGRDPARWFSTREYLKRYVDVEKSEINPFLHFIEFGLYEGRIPGVVHAQESGGRRGASANAVHEDYFFLKRATKGTWWKYSADSVCLGGGLGARK